MHGGTMAARGSRQNKERITISVDAELLRAVDVYVEGVKSVGQSRSSVIEQALHLWKQQMRDQFDAEYYSENADALSRDGQSWSAVTKAAATPTWNE